MDIFLNGFKSYDVYKITLNNLRLGTPYQFV